MASMIKLQIGKNGFTPEFMYNLKTRFADKGVESVRISLLKTSSRDKEQIQKWADAMIVGLGPNFTSKIIGYTIALRKWRKARA
jgi:RNA-binding protein YhbY